MLLLHVCFDTVQELLHIGCTGLSLNACITLVEHQQSRLHCKCRRHRISIFLLRPEAHPAHQFTELTDLLDSCRLQSESLKIISKGSLKQRGAMSNRRSRQGCHRCVTYAPCRLVHHPLERLVVVDIHSQFEIGHHILDLGSLKERITRIYHIRKIPFSESLLKSTRLCIGPIQYCKILILSRVRMNPRHYRRSNQ